MKHAGPDALDSLEPVLVKLRKLPGLTEKKRGSFHRRSSASGGRHRLEGFIHFHEDPAGFFADVKIEGAFARYPVNTKREEAALLKTAAAALKDG